MEVEVLRDRGGRYIGRERVLTDGLTLGSTLPDQRCLYGLGSTFHLCQVLAYFLDIFRLLCLFTFLVSVTVTGLTCVLG